MMEPTPTPKEEIQERIAKAQARYEQLVQDAWRLGEREYAAQTEDDKRAVVAIRAEGREMPRRIGEAKADKLEAMAEQERLAAREKERQAEPIREQMLAIEAEIRQLEGERGAIRDRADSLRRAANHHLQAATKYRHEATRLRDIHDPRKQEPLAS